MKRSLLLATALALVTAHANAQEFLAFVGTYTNTSSRGIYAYRFNAGSGGLTPLRLGAQTDNPTFLAIHPNGNFLYAVNEINKWGDREGGSVTSFSIDRAGGRLTELNRVTSRTTGPCHLAVDPTGRMLVVANYAGGSTESYQIKPDGSLSDIVSFIKHTGTSVNPRRQNQPHAHMAIFAPGGKFVFVPDLGADTVVAYRPDPAAGTLTPVPSLDFKVKPGAGPRHMDFHPNGKFAYVLSEMGSTITVFSYDAATGRTKEIQAVSTLPSDFSGNSSTAEIFIDKKGRFLYASNRGHDSIAVFAVDAQSGKLTLVERTPTEGRTPRNFALDPTGAWLVAANQDTDNLVPFRIDAGTGKLTRKGDSQKIARPVCVLFVPSK